MRQPILNGKAVLLIEEGGCITGIEFPDYGAADNPTQPLTISFNHCQTQAFAEAVAAAVLGIV